MKNLDEIIKGKEKLENEIKRLQESILIQESNAMISNINKRIEQEKLRLESINWVLNIEA